MNDYSWLPGAVPGATRVRKMEAYAEDGWQRSPSGLYIPTRPKRPKPRPIAIDLFAGAGGFSLGTMQAGFEVVAALDNDVDATITYTYNLGAYPMQFHFATDEDKERMEKALRKYIKEEDGVHKMTLTAGGNARARPDGIPGVRHFFFGDVRQFTGQQILDALGLDRGDVDLVMGGPPCQGFSFAGKRNVVDPRNSLVFEFTRLVLEIMPKSMVLENVPGMLSMVTPEGVPVIDALCHTLANGGFGTYEALKKSLTYNHDAGMAIRGTTGRKVDNDEEDESKQLSLFD